MGGLAGLNLEPWTLIPENLPPSLSQTLIAAPDADADSVPAIAAGYRPGPNLRVVTPPHSL